MKGIAVFLFLVLISATTQAQAVWGKVNKKGDTLLMAAVPTVVILGKKFANNQEVAAFYNLKYNVGVVYPYAKIAGEIYRQMNDDMDGLKNRDKRHYKKQEEQQLREKFSKELENLNTTQGEILIKLINRETNNNCYKLIKDLKNPMAAFFYQLVAKHWGYNLKEEYSAADNRDLEFIVEAMEHDYPIK